VKALLEVPGMEAKLDPVALDQIFTFWFPDGTTLWLFREKLAKAGSIEKLFEQFGRHEKLKIVIHAVRATLGAA
jgi:hypothetical protein